MAMGIIFPLAAPSYVRKGASRFYAKIESREVFLRCIELYTPREQAVQRIVAVPPDDLQLIQEKHSAHLGFQGVTVAGGGADWFACVGRALEKLHPEIDTVMIHDPCCPAVPFTLLDAIEEALAKNPAAAGVVPILPSRAAYCDLDPQRQLKEYVDMAAVSEVQSPQLFRRAALVDAYAKRNAASFVDDAECVMAAGHKIITIGGSRFNMRIDSDDMVRLGKDLLEHMPRPKPKTPLTPFGEAEW